MKKPDDVLSPAPVITSNFFFCCRNERNECIASLLGCWVRYDGIIRFVVAFFTDNDSVIDSAIADDSMAGVVRESILEADEYLKDALLR
jgi:hypothetical protein